MAKKRKGASLPDWAKKRPGQKDLQRISLLERLLVAVAPDKYHANCGGRWQLVGSSGLATHSEYFRCDRCGAQTGKCFISMV